MSKSKKTQHILIIGGMGPQAGAHTLKRLIDVSSEYSSGMNEDYPRVTYLSLNVEDFISDSSKKDVALAYILDCLKDVNLANVNKGFIACNTAHLLFGEIQMNVSFELLSLIDVTKDYLANTTSIKKVGLLATPTTIQTGLYSPDLFDTKEIVLPTKSSSLRLEGIIRKMIRGVDAKDLIQDFQKEADALYAQGVDAIIVGCTELSMIAHEIQDSRIIDPIEQITRRILA